MNFNSVTVESVYNTAEGTVTSTISEGQDLRLKSSYPARVNINNSIIILIRICIVLYKVLKVLISFSLYHWTTSCVIAWILL